jgi:hypothetical protein
MFNPMQQQKFSSFFRARSTHLFSQQAFFSSWPDQVDPGGSLKLDPAPQQFYFSSDFETDPDLIICGHHHDIWP